MTSADVTVLPLHLAVTAVMAGLIWFVQVVHYPLLARVGRRELPAYELAHQQRTTLVVGPFMAAEGLLALLLLAAPPAGLGRALPLIGLVLLAAIHASTVWLQVPAHRVLADRPDPATVQRLVGTNWIRTAGWTARSAVAVAMLVVVAS
jgi:hypothetical protein